MSCYEKNLAVLSRCCSAQQEEEELPFSFSFETNEDALEGDKVRRKQSTQILQRYHTLSRIADFCFFFSLIAHLHLDVLSFFALTHGCESENHGCESGHGRGHGHDDGHDDDDDDGYDLCPGDYDYASSRLRSSHAR